MKCPKCGYERQPNDNKFSPPTECPACGVVYAKTVSSDTAQPAASGIIKKPSPVNEASLKRARERVEKRLRQRMETGQKDERTEKTLQRAKRFAADGVRQRQKAWKDRQANIETGPDDLTMSEAAIRVKDPTIDLTAFKGGALTMFGVIRPEKGPNVADDSHHKTEQSMRKSKTTVSLTDSLAQMPPGDTLSFDKQPKDPAAQQMKAKRTTAEAITPEQTSQTPTGAPLAIEEPSTDHCPPLSQRPINEDNVKPSTDRPQAVTVEEIAPAKEVPPAMRPGAQNTNDASIPEMATRIVSEKGDDAVIHDRSEQSADLVHMANRQPASALMRLLPAAAWLILVIGLTGAVLSWTTLKDVQANIAGAITTSVGAVPIALLLGFAYLATGVLGFAFFWVCATIGGQLKEIQQVLTKSPRQDKKDTPK